MFLYFLVIPFILPFAPSLVKGDGWAAVETEIFILYSQGSYHISSHSGYMSCSSSNKNNPETRNKCIFGVVSGFLQCFFAPIAITPLKPFSQASHFQTQRLSLDWFLLQLATLHGQAPIPCDPPDPAFPGTVCSSPFELCQDPGTSCSLVGSKTHLCLAQNPPCRKRPGGPGGPQGAQESAACPCSEDGQTHMDLC